MPVHNLNQIYFKEVQQIAYKFITSEKDKYDLSASEEAQLKMIAVSNEPSCAYARSLYHELTGTFIPIKIPEIEDVKYGQKVDLRSGSSTVSLQATTFYPNPVHDILSISNESSSNIAFIQIFAMDGRLVYELNDPVKANIMDIDVSSLNNGVYLLNILKENGKKSVDKITVQH